MYTPIDNVTLNIFATCCDDHVPFQNAPKTWALVVIDIFVNTVITYNISLYMLIHHFIYLFRKCIDNFYIIWILDFNEIVVVVYSDPI